MNFLERVGQGCGEVLGVFPSPPVLDDTGVPVLPVLPALLVLGVLRSVMSAVLAFRVLYGCAGREVPPAVLRKQKQLKLVRWAIGMAVVGFVRRSTSRLASRACRNGMADTRVNPHLWRSCAVHLGGKALLVPCCCIATSRRVTGRYRCCGCCAGRDDASGHVLIVTRRACVQHPWLAASGCSSRPCRWFRSCFRPTCSLQRVELGV